MTLYQDVAKAAARKPLKAALTDASGATLSFGDLVARADALASTWRQSGVSPRDRVLVLMAPGADLCCALLALWRLGAAAAVSSPNADRSHLVADARAFSPDFVLAASEAPALRLLSIPSLWRSRRLPLVSIDGPDAPSIAWHRDTPALLLRGDRSGVGSFAFTHGLLTARGRVLERVMGTDAPDERVIVSGLEHLIQNLRRGVTSIMPPWDVSRPAAISAEAVADLIQLAPTRLIVALATLERLLDLSAVPAGVRRVVIDGGVGPDFIARMTEEKPDVDFCAVHGSLQASPIAWLSNRSIRDGDLDAMRNGAGRLVGFPPYEIELRIADGEIQVSGESVVAGHPEAAGDGGESHEDGRVWHRTGTTGRLDAQGRLWLN